MGPGYWLATITGLQAGRVRRFRGGRVDRWFVAAPLERRSYEGAL